MLSKLFCFICKSFWFGALVAWSLCFAGSTLTQSRPTCVGPRGAQEIRRLCCSRKQKCQKVLPKGSPSSDWALSIYHTLVISKADGKHSCSLLLFPFVSCELLYKGLKPEFMSWRKPGCDYFKWKLCIRGSFFNTPVLTRGCACPVLSALPKSSAVFRGCLCSDGGCVSHVRRPLAAQS